MQTFKKITAFLFLIVFGTIINTGISQTLSGTTNSEILPDTSDYPYWWEMMQDPEVNFYDTQRAFYKYWENREIKGGGYKQFKRWEYRMERRILPDGTIPTPDLTWDNFQEYKTKHPRSLKNAEPWIELGPRVLIGGGGYDGLGRINGIGFHPTNPDIIYIGSPSGGLWLTEDGGESWTTHTDNLPTLGISDIQINYNNPDTMYIGTGDRDGGDSYGMGVMKSVDAGLTWEFSNNGMGNAEVAMMVMHNTNPDIIVAATQRGIYKTIDAGANWVLKSENAYFKDIKYKPGDMNVLYAAKTGDFYRSIDGGESWAESGSDSLPGSGRFVIGVSPANDSIVYVAVAASVFTGLYESRDFGVTFTQKSDSPNLMGYSRIGDDDRSQSGYDFCLAVDPNNENIILLGGINQWRSIDGGVSWYCTGHWTGSGPAEEVHADQHTMFFSPADGKLYIGNDGGIYVTGSNGTVWRELSDGLGISQVYKIAQSATMRDKVVNGYQDNGTMTYMGNNGLNWVSTGGGDGFEGAVDFTDASYSYTSLYYGAITRRINNIGNGKVAGEDFNGINESGAWITPFCLHETDPNTMLIGFKNIWRTKNVKAASRSTIKWVKLSNNLAGSNSSNISVVEHSPANTRLFYFARSDRKLFRTDNIMGTPTWDNLTSKLPNNSTPTDLEAHPYDENILYMTQSNRIYKSPDKGSSWFDISGSLPNISMNDIAYDLSSKDGLYVATDAGVYFKDGVGIDWIFYGDGLPTNVSIEEIEIYQDPDERELSRLRVGTYGRGLWENILAPFSGTLPPSGLFAEAGNGIVSMSWKEPFYHDNVSRYNIYRNGSLLDVSDLVRYEDLSVENGVSYTYYIKALYTDGGESDPSNSVSVTPIAPITLPYSEDFENGDGAWSYKNSAETWRWGIARELDMEDDEGNQTYFFGINSVTGGDGVHTTDYLISPLINLLNFSNVTLSFDYLLRRYMNYDKLYVVYRTSPTNDWTEIEELAKTGKWDSWTNYSINMPIGAMSDNLEIAFYYDDSDEFAWGAAIDNVQLFENTSSVYDLAFDKKINISPNPTNGEIEIRFIQENPSDVLISVFTMEGRKVLEKNYIRDLSEFRKKILLGNHPKGIYNVRIISNNKTANRKITIR